MSKGIKELSELLESIGMISKSAKKISKGGIGIDDIAELVKLARGFDDIAEGFKGVSEIKEELKDLDSAEIMAIVSMLIDLVKDIEKA